MPSATLSRPLLDRLLKRTLTNEELERLLFRTKVELGEAQADTLALEVTPDRLDLLSESGLALCLEGLLGLGEGCPYVPERKPQAHPSGSGEDHLPLEAIVDPSVSPLRRELRMAVARAPPGASLDAEMLHELVRFQELLHATIGADRQRASLGLYPLSQVHPPFTYAMEGLDGIRFTPLPDGEAPPSEMGGLDFFSKHPMAAKYGSLGRARGLALTLRDGRGQVLSLPPILNAAKFGEVRPGETAVLLESTGTLEVSVTQLVGYLLLPFVARGWRISPVPIHRRGRLGPGTEVISTRTIAVSSRQISEVLGSLPSRNDVRKALLASRLAVEEARGGWKANVPPWRPDLLGPVDLAEEVVLAVGLESLQPVSTTPETPGSRLPSTRLHARFREVLVGMGYQEAHTPVFLSRTLAETLTRKDSCLALSNPVSQEFAMLRPTLLPGLVEALGRNTQGRYPQRLFELAEVVVRDPTLESGTRTDTHLALVDAGEGAGFATAAAVAERLARVTGILPVREAAEAPGAIPGRVGVLQFAGEEIALMGEVHPQVLTRLGIHEPVSWVEVDLSIVERLKGLPSP